MSVEPSKTTVSRDDFATLYSRCHLDLLRYVWALLADRHLAEDVVQDTARVLWRKFDEYDPARPFWPWARQFAHFEVLKARRRRAVDSRCFSDEGIERIASEHAAAEETLAERREALTRCIERLDGASRELLMSRYEAHGNVQRVAARIGKSANACSLMLHRIRQRLIECVDRTMQTEGGT
jgi:RNA polymerase sigma-70 factor, ECF subfamily